MAEQTVEIFLHGQGVKPKVAQGKPSESLRDVLLRSGFMKNDDKELHIFVGECDESLREPEGTEEGSDEQAPVDPKRTVDALDLARLRHVHGHTCRRIAATVNFSGGSKRRKFSPATTIEVVTQWARKRFKLDDAAADELVLQVCSSTMRPRSDQYLGELTEVADCMICFDLVNEVTPQG